MLLSHLGSPHFEYQAVFCDFLQSPLQDVVTEYLKISHDQFLSNPIQLTIYKYSMLDMCDLHGNHRD